MAQLKRPGLVLRMAALGVLGALAASAAQAQSIDTNSAEFNAGWGRRAGQENHIVDFNTRDANGNRVIVDGLILSGEDQSTFSRAGAFGTAGAYSGVGSLGGSASAIGNSLNVITQGSNNTVIVDSTQINNGNISAGTTLNGGVNTNGH